MFMPRSNKKKKGFISKVVWRNLPPNHYVATHNTIHVYFYCLLGNVLVTVLKVYTSTGIFERFRGILHEGEIDKRVQFMIEGLFAIRKAKFQVFFFLPFFFRFRIMV